MREPGRSIYNRFDNVRKVWNLENIEDELDSKVRIDTLGDLKKLMDLIDQIRQRPTPPDRGGNP
jgi:hypothetical protein